MTPFTLSAGTLKSFLKLPKGRPAGTQETKCVHSATPRKHQKAETKEPTSRIQFTADNLHVSPVQKTRITSNAFSLCHEQQTRLLSLEPTAKVNSESPLHCPPPRRVSLTPPRSAGSSSLLLPFTQRTG